MESQGHHSKARSQDNPFYPERFPVPVYKVDWGEPFAEYQPRDWTADVVVANNRELTTGHQWAVRRPPRHYPPAETLPPLRR